MSHPISHQISDDHILNLNLKFLTRILEIATKHNTTKDGELGAGNLPEWPFGGGYRSVAGARAGRVQAYKAGSRKIVLGYRVEEEEIVSRSLNFLCAANN